jgi:mannitol-1-/sugar-/sorbitol-6-phosphatase
VAALSGTAALLLDLDGTLVDSEPVHRAAYAAFFAARGWSVHDDTYAHFVGRRGADVFGTLPGPWTGEDPEALVAEVFEHLAHVEEAPAEARGARLLVRSAHARGIPLALVTSATREWAEHALAELLGLREHFDVVVTWEDVPEGKPHPEPYELGCRRLGIAPSRTAAVEDSVAGVRSAVAAGVGTVVGVATTTAGALLLEAGAHHVVAHLEELEV